MVDKSGNFKGDANEGATQLTESLGFKPGNVKNVKKYLEIVSIPTSGKSGATFTKDDKKKTTKVTYKSQTVEVPQTVLDTQGKVVTEDDTAVEELLNNLHTTFELTMLLKIC